MIASERKLIRVVAWVLVGMYFVLTLFIAYLKAAKDEFIDEPWHEIVLGPAILLGCCFGMFYGSISLYRLRNSG